MMRRNPKFDGLSRARTAQEWAWLKAFFATLLILAALPNTTLAQSESTPTDTAWYAADEDGAVRLNVHFFWAIGCPYCKRERAFLDTLVAQYSWLNIVDYEISEVRENIETMMAMAVAADGSTSLVPTTFVCNQMTVGFQTTETTGEVLHTQIVDCYRRLVSLGPDGRDVDIAELAGPPPEVGAIDLPLIGRVDANTMSLPLLTLAIASVDAFNPCGLFVLLMLMSMMIRARSRAHMAAIGATFAVTWGAMYFGLMAAWLSLFQFVGDVRAITMTAGALVLVMAALNFKDFLGVERGPSLSMTSRAKGKLFQRMGALVHDATKAEQRPALETAREPMTAARFAPMIGGTVLLTLSAGGYAMLCTTGFAMTYTRVLTLHELPTPNYLLYLCFYVLIYLIPMSLIVVAFTATLGARKLTDAEGRALKLLAAIMLSGLGIILLSAPNLLKNPLIVVAVMAGAFVVTAIVMGAKSVIRDVEAGHETKPHQEAKP